MLSGRSPRPQSNLRWSLTAGGGRRNEVGGSAACCSCGNCRRARCRRALRLDAGRRTVKLTDGFARWASGSAVPRQALPGFRGESRGLLQCGVDSLRSVRATWVCRVSGCYCAVDRAIWSGSQMFGNLAFTNAGWSSSVARWAHNPEVAGSNPVPATSGDGPQAQSRRAIFMRVGNALGNIRNANDALGTASGHSGEHPVWERWCPPVVRAR